MHEYEKLLKEGIIIGLEHAARVFKNFPAKEAIDELDLRIAERKRELVNDALNKGIRTDENLHALP